MTGLFGGRGVLYALLLIITIVTGVRAIDSLAGLRHTFDLAPSAITGYDSHRAEVEFTRLLDSLALYVAGHDRIDLDEVTTRFDILWARCLLFIKGQAFEVLRERTNLDEVSADLLAVLQHIENDVFTLERGDLAALARIRERLLPFEDTLIDMTTRIVDLEVATRDEVSEAIDQGLAKLDGLALTVALFVVVILALFGFEAVHARRAEKQLADYQEHLEQLVAERTDALRRQALRLEEALGRERELSELQRQFVSMVSHEFRTPLAIIDGSIQHLQRRLDRLPKDKVLSGFAKIERAVRRLLHLMESTLSASRLEAGTIAMTIRPCDLRTLLEEVCNDQQAMSREHDIVADLAALPPSIEADEALMRQTFSNLLSNAVKYSPGGRHVWVEGRIEDEHAVITVRDEGVGIPKAELPRLFERYFRASTSTGIPGTGIGLNFVRHLVEMHQGRIEVATQPGEGSAFTVSLPIAGPRRETSEPPEEAEAA